MAYDKVTASMRKKWENEYVKGTSLDDFVDARIKANPILGTGTLQQNEQLTNSDIAPVVGSDNDAKRWYQQIFSRGTLFDDNDGGWFSDTYKTANATGLDMMADVQGGYANSLEKAIDFVAGLIGKLGSDKFQAKTGEFIEKDLINEKKFTSKLNKITNPIAYLSIRKEFKKAYEEAVAQGYEGTEDDFYIEFIENASVFGDFTDSMAQSGGELLAVASLPGGKTQAAAKGWGIAKRIIQGVTAAGGEMESALTQGGATYDEALFSGLVVGGAAALLSEMGSIKFGGVTVPNSLKQALATKVSNSVVRTALSVGCDIAAEGAEEFLEEVIGKLGKKLSYESEKTWKEVFASQEALDDYVSSFVGGGIFGAFGSVPKLSDSASTKRDYTTGLTANEQKVFDKVYEDTIAKREENGDKLTKKDKDEIYNDVMEKLEKGYISIDTIEEVLGGDAYTAYSDAVKNADALVEQEKKLKAEFDTLNKMKKSDMTGEQTDRLEELRGQLKNIKAKISENKKNSQAGKLKSQLSESVRNSLTEVDSKSGKTIRSDDHLLESYNEIARKNQKFEADLSKYDEKQRAAVQRAIDGGLLNNTNKSHDMVDSVANWEAATGIKIDFTNTELLNKMGIGVKGRIVNGAITKDGIAVNIKSKKALNFIVGHELTHAVEQTGKYNDLKDILLTHAKAKGDYNWRAEAIKETYKGLKDTDIDSEIVADLVGEYIFSDKTFVNSLYKKNRNIFQRIYDEIKRLWRLATAGSKEKRELEIAKNLFEDAIRENAKAKESGKADGEVKHSLGYHAGDLGKAESLGQQSGGRDTGHFGTGTYFVGDEAQISDSTYGKRPHVTVDFDKYKLFKPETAKNAQMLHDFLKGVNYYYNRDTSLVSTDEEINAIKEQIDELTYDELTSKSLEEVINLVSKVAGKYKTNDALWSFLGDVVQAGDGTLYKGDEPMTTRDVAEAIKDKDSAAYKLQKLLDDGYVLRPIWRFQEWNESVSEAAEMLGISESRVRKLMASINAEIAAAGYDFKSRYTADSASTRFMKALGYEGIDVRGIKGFDNTAYGSVIYDLKGEDLAKKNEIGTAKYLLSIDNEADNEYNDYTQTEDFYKRVPYTMQSDFRVYLSHKTNGMAEGETRTFYICGFIFEANGYMQGEILAKYSKRTKKLLYESEASYESINTNTRGSSVWSETIQYAGQRRGGDNGVSRGGEGSSNDDVLLGDTQGRFASGNNERVWTLAERKAEIDELVSKLRKKLETWGDEPLEVDEDIEQFNNSLKASLKNGAFSNGEGAKLSLSEENVYVPAEDTIKYNLSAVESHKKELNNQYKVDASAVALPDLMKRYDKIVGIWERLGGELNSDFLKEWNAKKGKDRAFSVFKAQAGYKYNVELSSMCKKGVPLFEAIDKIVKKEVMNDLNTKVIGKAEKEILYDILKQHDFEIPCAICYVEQARQREGVIINDFLNGKAESNKLGWNQVLERAQEEMAKNGVNYTFRKADRSIATDNYSPAVDSMDEATQDAFYSALQKMANEEIAKYNAETKEKNLKRKIRPQLKDTSPNAIKQCFNGTLPANLKIFKTLFTEPSSRFMIDQDLLYSSMTTHNLANSHNGLYSLFNSQGGVSGYKTKQGTVVYWGDILNKKWDASKLRNEGGVRNQSNSDFQMYTLLDQAQMYMDFTAKGYYLQAYTKVLAELKLFGLSRGKINASLIPAVKVYYNADGTVDVNRTMDTAGLDENGELFFDDFEGIEHKEAFMLISDPEYSKNIGGICIGYSDKHISKLLDDPRVQLIIGFHDKTNDSSKRYRGAKYAKNYNGLNEAVNKDGETVHIGFNNYVKKAEKMFTYDSKTESFSGTTIYNGMPYTANDIPKLAADLYLADCVKKGYTPAYNQFRGHENYYKLLADFSLYDSQGQYAPHRKVAYDMPDKVPYLDKNGAKKYMDSEKYIKQKLSEELKVRDAISDALSDDSENGILSQFVKRVNELHSQKSLSMKNEPRRDTDGWQIYGEDVEYRRPKKGDIAPIAPTATHTETKTAVNASVEDREDIAPVKAPRNPNALSPLKAPANKGDKTIEELVAEHGAIKQGEHPVRNDEMPKSTTGTDKVSNTARTVKGAKVTPPELVDLLNKETAGGRLSYVPITNSETVDKAYASIVSKGWEAARGEWETRVRRGEVSAELTATGSLLLNNAAKAGDSKAWLDILQNYQLMGTNAGQAVQAMRILKTLTPSDSLYMIQRSVEQMVEDMKLGVEITLDENLKKAYINAKTDAEKDAARKALAENVASQIPATAMDKWTAIRYLNMLGNFRTQSRNVLGNLGMSVTSRVKNTVAATIEGIAEKASGGEFQRTKSVFVNKDLLNAAKEDFDNVKSIALNGGKFNDSQTGSNQFQQEIQDARTIFAKNKPLEKYRKLTNLAMDKGDLVFSKAAYGRALAGYLQANGIKETDFSKIDQKTLDKARDYAVKEAQETTFRDNNWLSSWVTKIGRRSDTPKAGKLLSEGIMPFRKTPANILLRAEEYSPLGIINATVNSIKLAKGNDNVTGADVVNSWSKALTGTGLFALGMLLNNAGALAGGADEDEDKDWFESMYGWQNYAIQIGDYNFTIDFLSPSAMPLLMGAQLNKLRQDGGIELKDLESALLSIADPMIEMSMLQGVSDTLDNVRYAENNMGQFLINACLSYLTQGITNSFLGQLERSFEGQRMTTYVDKDSAVPAWLQKWLGKTSAKIPGIDYNQIPYVDAWGQTEDIAPVGGLLENTLSPSYISEGFSDKVYEELNRLNDAQSDINVYPQTPEKTIGDYNLSAEEYERLAKLQGQTQKALVEEIISNDVYAELTDDEKAKAIQLAYKYAKEYSRQQVLNSNGFSTKWMSEAGDNIVDEIITHTSEERTFAKENPGKYAVAKSVGGYDQYRTYTKELNNFKVSEKKEIYDYINGLDVDYGTKIILYKNKCKSDDTYNNDIVEYLNSRDDISVAEIKSILTELGFTVHSNGRVTW